MKHALICVCFTALAGQALVTRCYDDAGRAWDSVVYQMSPPEPQRDWRDGPHGAVEQELNGFDPPSIR